MKLKLVVASMSVLGLVSCPVFAATTPTKHKHHHHKHHHKMMREHETPAQERAEERAERHDYKDMGMPAPEVCAISHNAMIMDSMTQSIGRSMPSPCNPGWFNRVQFSGGVNVDLGKWGNRNGNYMGENYQRFSLNDAYLNVAALVNDWAKAFASISYDTATIQDPGSIADLDGEYSSAYSNNMTGGGSPALQLEQAYATFGNFDVSPIFVQIGKQYQDFSRYEIHPITRSLTQVMSETLAVSGKIGFIADGFSGSLFAFDDPIAKVGQSYAPTNYGVALGYDMPSDSLGFDIGAAYLYNLIGVNDVAYMVNQWNAAPGGGYNTRVGAAAVYADVNSGPFIISGRYTAAVQRFNPMDLPKNGLANVVGGVVSPTASGAKPWAAGIQAGYGFDAWGRNQNVYVGYQASREAAGLNMPKDRWYVGYGVDVMGKNTNLGIQWDHDQAYSVGNGGTGNNTNLVSLRAGVQFG